MATDARIHANRANAERSTGPRTAEGRRRSSANAIGHGLTTALPAARVLHWYRRIVGDAEGEAHSVRMSSRHHAAMELAEAEADLERTREAEEDFLWDFAKDQNLLVHLCKTTENVEFILRHIVDASPEVERLLLEAAGLQKSETICKIRTHLTAPHVHHERLARHRRAAEVRRHKALIAWTEILESGFSRTKPSTTQSGLTPWQ